MAKALPADFTAPWYDIPVSMNLVFITDCEAICRCQSTFHGLFGRRVPEGLPRRLLALTAWLDDD